MGETGLGMAISLAWLLPKMLCQVEPLCLLGSRLENVDKKDLDRDLHEHRQIVCQMQLYLWHDPLFGKTALLRLCNVPPRKCSVWDSMVLLSFAVCFVRAAAAAERLIKHSDAVGVTYHLSQEELSQASMPGHERAETMAATTGVLPYA